MKKLIHLFCAFTLIVFMFSCSHELHPFTSNVLQEGRWSDIELGKIQYYLSDDIVIRRNLTDGANEISSGGAIKIVKGEKVE